MVNISGIDTSVLASYRMLKSLFSFINTSLGLWWRDLVTWMTSLSHLSQPLLRGLILPDGFFNSTTISGGNYSRTVETPMQKGNYIYCCFLARDRICRQGNSWKPIKNWHKHWLIKLTLDQQTHTCIHWHSLVHKINSFVLWNLIKYSKIILFDIFHLGEYRLINPY